MICGRCGKQNDETEHYCSYCNALLTESESDRLFDKNRYENDLGFADPASEYIKPKVQGDQEGIDSADTVGKQEAVEEAGRLARGTEQTGADLP